MRVFVKNIISIIKFIFSLPIKPKKASVLMYHSVSDDGRFFSVRPQNFHWQLKFLHENNFNIISATELYDTLAGKKDFSYKSVVLSFDDGYQDNYSVVFPLLKRYNIKAVIFLVINFVGKEGYLSWDEIAEMKNSGLVDFYCHTMSHPDLSKLSASAIKKELQECKTFLEEKLALPCDILAYPKGRFNDMVVQKAKDCGFKMAFGVREGAIAPGNDLFDLPRLSIDGSTTKSQFLAKVSALQFIKGRI